MSSCSIDRKKLTLSSGLIERGSLAWSRDDKEIWFSGVRSYAEPALHAVSLTGAERVLLQTAPQAMLVLDVSRDGRALIGLHHRQKGLTCLAPGESRPRELGWLDFSNPEALSNDGRIVVFGEVLTGSASAVVTYLRRTDGSDAIRLGGGLSRDPRSRWKVCARRDPMDEASSLGHPADRSRRAAAPAARPVSIVYEANFLPDGKRIVFGAMEPGATYASTCRTCRMGRFVRSPPEGVRTDGLATPDGRFVVGSTQGRHMLYPVDEGAPRPLAVLAGAITPPVESGWASTVRAPRRRVATGDRQSRHGDRSAPDLEGSVSRRSGGDRRNGPHLCHAGREVLLPRLSALAVATLCRRGTPMTSLRERGRCSTSTAASVICPMTGVLSETAADVMPGVPRTASATQQVCGDDRYRVTAPPEPRRARRRTRRGARQPVHAPAP